MTPRTKKVTMLIVVAALMVVGSMAVASPVQAQTCPRYHVVQPGQNLYRIALAYGTTWPTLAYINGIVNPNRILVGQIICLPGGTVPPPPPPPPPVPYYPPPGVFPFIDFNTRFATNGDTITITGVRFPGNSTVDIFIAPRIPGGGTVYPATPSGSATVGADGTLSTAFVVPNDVAGVPLRGASFSVLVRARGSGYFAFNFFWNRAP